MIRVPCIQCARLRLGASKPHLLIPDRFLTTAPDRSFALYTLKKTYQTVRNYLTTTIGKCALAGGFESLGRCYQGANHFPYQYRPTANSPIYPTVRGDIQDGVVCSHKGTGRLPLWHHHLGPIVQSPQNLFGAFIGGLRQGVDLGKIGVNCSCATLAFKKPRSDVVLPAGLFFGV